MTTSSEIPVPRRTVIGDYPNHLLALSTTPPPDDPCQSGPSGCLDTTRRPRSLSGPCSWGPVRHITQSSNIKDEKSAEVGRRIRHAFKREMSSNTTLLTISRGVSVAFSFRPLSLIHAITIETPRNMMSVGGRTATESEQHGARAPDPVCFSLYSLPGSKSI